MTREQLEHAIRAACDVTGDDEVYVFGSQAILGQHPDVPEALRMSAEADISPKHRLDRIEQLNSIGEESQFHREHGFYVHGVPITEAAKLPHNWDKRTVLVRNAGTRNLSGLCLESHDLAASKLAAYRDKDRDFVRTLLAEKLLKPRTLIARIRLLPVDAVERERLVRWVDYTVREL
jgi:hypothetical protein